MLRLYSYWRSSSAYRVRIALNLKQLDYAIAPINLANGEQRQAEYARRNPDMLVPALEHDGQLITQSLAICDYLDKICPEPPLLPGDGPLRATILAFVSSIACDIQPLNNLRVLNHLSSELQLTSEQKTAWYRHWIAVGFSALEARLCSPDGGTPAAFCFGKQPTLADCYLMPQLYNARRFDCPLDDFPALLRVEARCNEHPAFRDAHPDSQIDKR